MNQRAWILCALKGTVENNKSTASDKQQHLHLEKFTVTLVGTTLRFSWGKLKIHIMAPKARTSFLDAKSGWGIYSPDSSLHWNNETKCDN